MGVQNSSRTRVAPVFDALMAKDRTGELWLNRLVHLGSRTREVSLPPVIGRLPEDHPRWWGVTERSLWPPKALLEWLVLNVTPESVDAAGDTGLVREKRRLLASKDSATVNEALLAIRRGERGRRWHNLEGPSFPDACLETDKILLVVEGKRTERSCTSKTKWMPKRSQLLRHMDAAVEIGGARRVLGLLVVEGDGKGNVLEPSDYWLEQSRSQYADSMLGASLPHRSLSERRELVGGVLGVTTWQRVCLEFDLLWPPLDDDD